MRFTEKLGSYNMAYLKSIVVIQKILYLICKFHTFFPLKVKICPEVTVPFMPGVLAFTAGQELI